MWVEFVGRIVDGRGVLLMGVERGDGQRVGGIVYLDGRTGDEMWVWVVRMWDGRLI